jgi:cellulose synthase/poly-beta-1,6-N-acetylglucosamine synthase-like glycosyltransferase
MTPPVAAALGALLAAAALPALLVWLLPLAADAAALLRARARRGRRRAAPRPPAPDEPPGRRRLLVVVPAHDEALLIEPCVRALRAMTAARSEHRIVVLADACRDATAALARGAGAEVVEHAGPEPLGKARLLEWYAARAPLAAHDALVVVDADSIVEPAFADALAAAGPLRDVVVQGYHDAMDPGASWLTRLARLLIAARYEGQYPLRRDAGLNCPLTGNGMCIGAGVLARHGVGAESIKEDLELYARYTAAGVRILYAPEARLRAQAARTLRQATVQRERWQAGRWRVCRMYWRRILRAPVPWAQRLDALAELTAMGPVAQASLALPLAAALAAVPTLPTRAVAAGLALTVLPAAAWGARALVRQPDRARLAGALLLLPAYAAWRLALVVRLAAGGGPRRWRRSPRHAHPGHAGGGELRG